MKTTSVYYISLIEFIDTLTKYLAILFYRVCNGYLYIYICISLNVFLYYVTITALIFVTCNLLLIRTLIHMAFVLPTIVK